MAAICCSSSVLFIPIFTFGIYLYKTTPTRHVRYHSVQSLPAWFFISPPPVWAGICRTARQGCLIPYSSLSCCNIPRTPLRLPCSPAEVSLSPGFQGSMPPLPHAGNAAPIFPSSVTIPRFTCKKHCHLPSTDKYFSAKLSPHHLYKCSRCFVSLHTDIPFRQA